jgi:hypothetical protein
VEEAGNTQGCRVTTTGFPGGQIDNKMATEGHRYAGRKDPELMRKSEIDEELALI